MNKSLVLLLINVVACFGVYAQLCQGSLGDPIINITFGKGFNTTSPGPQLAAATTAYQYVNIDCPDDGRYAIRASTNQCFGNTWHSFTDHTGDGNGYFMLINASFQPSAFYIDTVRGLCSNTTYEFASWVMNVLLPSSCQGNGIVPNLTYRIEKTDGTLLQSYNSGNIPSTSSPQWKQYGFFFTTPTGVSDVVLRIVNNGVGGCGNDLALDDITFRPCGPLLSPSVTGYASAVKEICEGQSTNVTFTCNVSAGYSNPFYQWQQSADNGLTWTNIIGANTTTLNQFFATTTTVGNYLFRLSVAEASNFAIPKCRINSTPLTVRVNAKPVVTVSSTSPLCLGDSLTLVANGGNTYTWMGPNSFNASSATVGIKNIQANQAGIYTVEATATAGCKNTNTINVVVNAKPIATPANTVSILCKGDSVMLSASGGTSYAWQPATGLSNASIASPKASPADSTAYICIVSNNFKCSDTGFYTIRVIKTPTVNAGPDKTIVEGQSILLEGNIAGNYASFYWSPNTTIDNINNLQPIVSPVADQWYFFNAIPTNNCKQVTDTVFVKVYKNVVIPNAFSPNGDGINDTWNIPALQAYPGCKISVYNRSGNNVFQSTNYNTPWNATNNGKSLPIGTYYYFIDLNSRDLKLTGSVTIIR